MSKRHCLLFQNGRIIVESSAYLNEAGLLSKKIPRSFKNIFKNYGPVTLPCVTIVLLYTFFYCPLKYLYIIRYFVFSRKLKFRLIIKRFNGHCFRKRQ